MADNDVVDYADLPGMTDSDMIVHLRADVSHLIQEVQILKQANGEKEKELQKLNTLVRKNEHQLESLNEARMWALRLRHASIENFKKRAGILPFSQPVIDAVYRHSEHGDPLGDARLWEVGTYKPEDRPVYVRIYGIDPEAIPELRDSEEMIDLITQRGFVELHPGFTEAEKHQFAWMVHDVLMKYLALGAGEERETAVRVGGVLRGELDACLGKCTELSEASRARELLMGVNGVQENGVVDHNLPHRGLSNS